MVRSAACSGTDAFLSSRSTFSSPPDLALLRFRKAMLSGFLTSMQAKPPRCAPGFWTVARSVSGQGSARSWSDRATHAFRLARSTPRCPESVLDGNIRQRVRIRIRCRECLHHMGTEHFRTRNPHVIPGFPRYTHSIFLNTWVGVFFFPNRYTRGGFSLSLEVLGVRAEANYRDGSQPQPPRCNFLWSEGPKFRSVVSAAFRGTDAFRSTRATF